MTTPRLEDPRHGTVAGYNRIPCREACCRNAMRLYKKKWNLDRNNGRSRIVPTLGTRRRIEALNWLGWSRAVIAERVGMSPSNMTRLLRTETMTATVAARFAAAYEEMCMQLPTGNTQAIANVRNRSRRLGYLPPLAWDNIDDPDETPNVGTGRRGRLRQQHDTYVDQVVVERVLAGERLECSRAERQAVIARWIELGRPWLELEQLTGWNISRELRREEAA